MFCDPPNCAGCTVLVKKDAGWFLCTLDVGIVKDGGCNEPTITEFVATGCTTG
jgi:hypothetical protein